MRALMVLLIGGLTLSCGSDGGTGGLKGTVKDKSGAAIGDAQVTAGTQTVKSLYSGTYELTGLPAGAITVSVTAGWFQAKQAQATVPAGGSATLDLQLDEMPLKLDPADQALVESYKKTFDWTKATVYMAIAPGPTRRWLDNAINYRNPAQYHDTSSSPTAIPSPPPNIIAGVAAGFNFPVGTGVDQALVNSSIVDTFAQTGLPATAATDFMLWTPMVSWLSGSKRALDAAVLNKVRAVGSAVSLQAWGGNTPKPQQIESVYLSGSDLWVKIVFEPFVQLGAGIADDDGDGKKEIFAKVDPKHIDAKVLDLLQNQYAKTTLGTLALKAELSEAMNELYSSTNLHILNTIGQPYTVPNNLGTINYPFVAHEQSGSKGKVQGVLLVAP
jgi:hypothetical protein